MQRQKITTKLPGIVSNAGNLNDLRTGTLRLIKSKKISGVPGMHYAIALRMHGDYPTGKEYIPANNRSLCYGKHIGTYSESLPDKDIPGIQLQFWARFCCKKNDSVHRR